MRQIILDTETTGLSPKQGHRIIEIGCVEMINRRLTGNHFHEYINPECDIDKDAQAVHGITREFLSDKPVFGDVAEAFIEYIQGAELIIHNAPFDVGFLDHELKLSPNNYKTIKNYCSVLDTLVLARKKHPGQKNNLDALCKRYKIDNFNRELHGALLDANILADVYLVMTAGQIDFLTKSKKTTTKSKNNIGTESNSTQNRNKKPLYIIYASKAELSAHQAFLKRLEKEKCE